MVVAIDACGMAVAKAYGYRVVANLRSRLGRSLRLEERQRIERSGSRSGRREGFFLAAFVVACRAGALVTQIREIVVARVPIGPLNIHARAGLDVHFHID